MVPDVRALVWNDDERRPRALVRLIVAAVLVVLVSVGTPLLIGPALRSVASPLVRLGASLALQALPGVVVLVVAAVVDRRQPGDLGLHVDRGWWLDAGFGVVLGATLMTGIFLLALAAGWIRIVGWFVVESVPLGFGGAFLAVTAFFVIAGTTEELLARGYLLTNVAEGLLGTLGRRRAVAVAVVVSSLLFGAAHVTNPNATLVSTLSVSLAGVLLATGYVLTDDLAIPIGLHVAWNLFQGPIYGFRVSGIALGVRVVDTVETGPDVATGGQFGPEAGLLGVAAVLTGIAATVGYVRWRYDAVRVAPGLTVPSLRVRRGDRDGGG
ncbi:MAG: lysostaphin resistance A-like protein [Haloarculaceae archaeon]